ncbi:unnamed protein product [Peronospora belbahrii]|uniref:Uncharacterized protein n=1 Tax=Peronospora belbahrii TaxID=622444 RepID=A0ABN8CRS2_9STRA|nr:unnamed protein product [Peronospora belbahrii]
MVREYDDSHSSRRGRQGQGRGRGRRREHDNRYSRSSRGRENDEVVGGKTRGYHVQRLPLNPLNLQFLRSVLKNCPNHKLQEIINQLKETWLHCWQGVESLPLDALRILLSALACLPFSASVAPPLSTISNAVHVFQSQVMPSMDNTLDGNDTTLEGVELVERVVLRLLQVYMGLEKR